MDSSKLLLCTMYIYGLFPIRNDTDRHWSYRLGTMISLDIQFVHWIHVI